MKRSLKFFISAIGLFLLWVGTSPDSLADLIPLTTRSSERQIPVHVADHEEVIATLRLPKNLRSGQKVPIFLIFGGFESAAHVLDLIHPDRAIGLASFDYPFSAPRQLYLKDSARILKEAKNLEPNTVRGIVDLVNALKAIPEVDSSRIVAIGASFGSPFVLAAAAADSDISGVALIHSFGLVPETAEHVILRSWLPKYGRVSIPFAWLISRLGWYYLGAKSPEADARRLRPGQRVLMITATDDSFVPQASSDSLWRAVMDSKADRKRILMSGDHLMPGSDKLIDDLVHRVESWMEAGMK